MSTTVPAEPQAVHLNHRALSSGPDAFADTLSGDAASLCFKHAPVNSGLVSALRRGIGDTAVSPVNSLVEITVSMDLPQQQRPTSLLPPTTQDKDTKRHAEEITTSEYPNCPDAETLKTLDHAANNFEPQNSINVIQDMNLSDTVMDPRQAKTPSREINVGSIVDSRYEVLSEISRGGHGVVYRARQIGLDRVVALKRLRAHQEKSITQRFFLEANIIKELVHPNTIQLYDAGVDDDHLYIVMEYIEGKSLRDLLIEEKRISIPRAIHIAIQILKSINEAHQRGIIHRDLKPSNIILRNVIGEKDFIKVLDFGIAKAKTKSREKLTQAGKIMGTPQYIAPELYYGDEATPAADLFTVGLMLVEMVTGKCPMPKQPKDIIRIATQKGPIPIPEWVRTSEIGHIVERALQKDRNARYRSAKDMIDDLMRVEVTMLYQEYKANAPDTLPAAQKKTSPLKYFIAALAGSLILIANIFLFLLMR
ncbi:MAG: serine/threonine protein kinase [Proteobacteria bacterium]|nr:serine/threonine protein kinase [Pseudomonadota bacterium]